LSPFDRNGRTDPRPPAESSPAIARNRSVLRVIVARRTTDLPGDLGCTQIANAGQPKCERDRDPSDSPISGRRQKFVDRQYDFQMIKRALAVWARAIVKRCRRLESLNEMLNSSFLGPRIPRNRKPKKSVSLGAKESSSPIFLFPCAGATAERLTGKGNVSR
jgi:hypothetical protein